MTTISLIKKTNGDILGVILFILLLIYFALVKLYAQFAHQSIYEWVLIIGCSIALVVDVVSSYKTIRSIA